MFWSSSPRWVSAQVTCRYRKGFYAAGNSQRLLVWRAEWNRSGFSTGCICCLLGHEALRVSGLPHVPAPARCTHMRSAFPPCKVIIVELGPWLAMVTSLFTKFIQSFDRVTCQFLPLSGLHKAATVGPCLFSYSESFACSAPSLCTYTFSYLPGIDRLPWRRLSNCFGSDATLAGACLSFVTRMEVPT